MAPVKPTHRGRYACVVCLLLLCAAALPVLAAEASDEIADERESPALRQPLPELAAPADGTPEEDDFSTEAPPPPPFDPSYQPPLSGPPDSGATK